jgi:hypothetical protein
MVRILENRQIAFESRHSKFDARVNRSIKTQRLTIQSPSTCDTVVTDAFALAASSSAIGGEGIDSFGYLGVVYEVVEKGEQWWVKLPPRLADELHGELLKGLIGAVKDDFLFATGSALVSVLFDSAEETDLRDILMKPFFFPSSYQSQLLM